MGKVISDHIYVVSQANGSIKAAPCWQIRVWIQKGSFDLGVEKGNAVGYDFKDYRSGVSEYEAWEKEQKRLEMIRKAAAAAPRQAEAGIADAQFHPKAAPKSSAFDEVPETGVPVMETGTAEKSPEVKPKDVI